MRCAFVFEFSEIQKGVVLGAWAISTPIYFERCARPASNMDGSNFCSRIAKAPSLWGIARQGKNLKRSTPASLPAGRGQMLVPDERLAIRQPRNQPLLRPSAVGKFSLRTEFLQSRIGVLTVMEINDRIIFQQG